MKYLCLVYGEEQTITALPDRDCAAYAEKLSDSGKMVMGQALQPVNTATTVRVRGDKRSITDGPFAETKEQLVGFYLIDASDLDEALNIAAGIPPARVGSIEVRPVRELDV